jgi:hypothetical protein
MKCLEARRKLLEARSAREAVEALREAARINIEKVTGKTADNSNEKSHGQSRA